MKKIDSVNNSKVGLGLLSGLKSRITSIKPALAMLALLMVALFGVNEAAWGSYRATVTLQADPSAGGNVCWTTSSSGGFSSCTSSSYTNYQRKTGLSTSGSFDFYFYAKNNSGYVFKGWASSTDVNSGTTNNPWKKNLKGSTSSETFGTGGEHYTYYAIFARLAANTPAAGSTTSFEDTNVGSESGWKQIKIDHAHAGTVSISQDGNAGDFYVASSKSATSEFSSFTSTE